MKPAHVLYTDHRGETAWRTVVPLRVHFGATAWHPVPQWLLDVHDVDKNEQRTLALADVHDWAQDGLGAARAPGGGGD